MSELIDKLLDEVAAAGKADGSVEAMWARVSAQAPDVHEMMNATIYPEGAMYGWWQDKPTQVLYRIVQLAALRQGQAADRIAALEAQIAAADRLADAVPGLMDFIERHSNRWDGIIGKHPMEIHIDVIAALAAYRAARVQP